MWQLKEQILQNSSKLLLSVILKIKQTLFSRYLLIKIQHEEEIYAQDSRICFLLNVSFYNFRFQLQN